MDCSPNAMGLKLLILGVIIILVRIFTPWDIWVVLGVLLVIKAIIIFLMQTKSSPKKRKKR